MSQILHNHHDSHHHDQETESKVLFGWWIYIMSDCFLFAALFAVYAVLHNNTFGGLPAKDILSLHTAIAETFVFLTSCLLFGYAMVNMHQGKKTQVIWLLIAAFIFGVAFIYFELSEFIKLVEEGNSWQRSGFLSAFFALVGTHGLHVFMGLIWMVSLIFQVAKHGITPMTKRKLMSLNLFWNFLDIIWIFVFTIVYLMGAI